MHPSGAHWACVTALRLSSAWRHWRKKKNSDAGSICIPELVRNREGILFLDSAGGARA